MIQNDRPASYTSLTDATYQSDGRYPPPFSQTAPFTPPDTLAIRPQPFRRSSAVEQLTVNQLVVGSIPTAGASKIKGLRRKT